MDVRKAGVLAALATLATGGVSAQEYHDNLELEARVWLDRGDEPVLQRGDRVRLYYRTTQDAFVAIFQIDTDGAVHLLFPRAPDEEHYVRGERDYRLLFPRSSFWYVDEYPGKGYFFMVASPEPFDFSAFDYAHYERSWDLTRVGRSVYDDPYVAIDDYVARLIPDWEVVPYALDFASYDVGERHDYPRFLCYDCHGYRSYGAWNPYSYACSTFRVVIWDDPYFYPAYRYVGTRVVFAQPRRGVPRFEFKERADGEPWKPLTRTRQPPPRRPVQYTDPGASRSLPRVVPPRRRVVPSSTLRGGEGAERVQRSPSPIRSAPPGTGSRPVPITGRTRPSTRGGTGAARAGRSSTSVPVRGQPRPTVRRSPGAATSSTGRAGVRTSSPGARARGVVPSRPGAATRSTGSVRRAPAGASAKSRSGSRTIRPSRPSVRTSKPTGSAKPRSGARAKPPPRRKPGGQR